MTRIKLLWRFVKLYPKAKEIELAWQKIQQDKHDFDFKNQVGRGTAEAELAYKRGIVDGIKWIINTFSL